MKRINLRRKPLILSAGVLAMLAGCTHVPLDEAPLPEARVEPVYRVQQPVGTAAGQYAVGRMELAAGRVDAAIVRFRQALQLDPTLVDAHNGLGVAYGQQGRLAEAEAAFRAALTNAPDASHLLNNLGYTQMRAGRFDDAWVSLDRAYRLDKANAQTRENLLLLAKLRAEAPAGSAVASVAPAEGSPTLPAKPTGATPAQAAAVPVAPIAVAPAAPAAQAIAPADPVAPNASTVAAAAAAPVAPNAPTVATVATAAPGVQAVAPVALPPPNAPTVAAVAPVATGATSAGVIVKPVPSRSAPASSLHGAVWVQSAPATVVQVSPGILELRPAPAPSPRAAAEPAYPSSAVVAPAALAVPNAMGLSPAAGSAAAPAVLLPPHVAAAKAPPAAKLASVRGSAPVAGFEVSNGVGARNLAGRMARALTRLGVSVDRVSDYRWFGVRRSQIHYREGHRDAAETVADTLPVKPRFVRSASMQPTINVRLVVGGDLSAKQLAWLGEESLQNDFAGEAAPIASEPAGLRPEATKLASVDPGRGWRHF